VPTPRRPPCWKCIEIPIAALAAEELMRATWEWYWAGYWPGELAPIGPPDFFGGEPPGRKG